MNERPPRLWPSLSLCLLILLGLLWVSARLTRNFECLTFEDLRRYRASEGQLSAPAVLLRDALGQPWTQFGPVNPQESNAVYLVDFIYTHCVSICSVLGSEYTQMQRALQADRAKKSSKAVRLLSISIDPAHEWPADLDGYARLHHADAAIWKVATPIDVLSVRRLQEQLGIIAIPDGLGGFLHNGAIQLIDAHGRVHAVFDYAQWPQAIAAAQALAARGV